MILQRILIGSLAYIGQTLSGSLGGLNCLIVNSLDAFQNCSFFGLDKKDTGSTVDTVKNSDLKIGGEV